MSKDEKVKISSEQTWNMLALLVIERANAVVTAKELKLYDEKDRINDKILKGDPAAIKNILKTKLVNAFNEAIDEHLKDPKFDKETAEYFKKNTSELANHILRKTKAFEGEDVNIGDAMETLRKEVSALKGNIEVNPKARSSNWQRVSDFCKSAKLDKLAEFCHDKHVESLTKEVSKELKVNLDKHQKPPSKLKSEFKAAVKNISGWIK